MGDNDIYRIYEPDTEETYEHEGSSHQSALEDWLHSNWDGEWETSDFEVTKATDGNTLTFTVRAETVPRFEVTRKRRASR